MSDYMLPEDKTPGQSYEIVQVSKHIYRVEELRDMSARLINLLEGSERQGYIFFMLGAFSSITLGYFLPEIRDIA